MNTIKKYDLEKVYGGDKSNGLATNSPSVAFSIVTGKICKYTPANTFLTDATHNSNLGGNAVSALSDVAGDVGTSDPSLELDGNGCPIYPIP